MHFVDFCVLRGHQELKKKSEVEPTSVHPSVTYYNPQNCLLYFHKIRFKISLQKSTSQRQFRKHFFRDSCTFFKDSCNFFRGSRTFFRYSCTFFRDSCTFLHEGRKRDSTSIAHISRSIWMKFLSSDTGS